VRGVAAIIGPVRSPGGSAAATGAPISQIGYMGLSGRVLAASEGFSETGQARQVGRCSSRKAGWVRPSKGPALSCGRPRSYKEIMDKASTEFKEYAQCLDWYG
jgi:hypothetical protein